MVLAMLTLVLGASVATYGSSLVRNDDVLWLYVEDIDLNDKSETENIEEFLMMAIQIHLH